MTIIKKQTYFGSLMAIAGALLFSFGGIIVKFLPWHALSVNSMRNAVALIITLIYIKKIRHKLKFNRWILLSAAGMASTTTLYCVANGMTTAANTILLQYTSPLFIILFSYIAFKIKPKKVDLIMCVAVFAGIICFFFDSLATGNMLGNFLALVSGCTYTVVFMSNMLPDGDALSAFFLGELLSVVVGIPFVVQETDFSPLVISGVVAMGIIIGGGYVLLSMALKYVKPVTANLLGTIEPIFNPVWVALLYGETLTSFAMIGFVTVIISVILYNIYIMKHPTDGARA